MQGLELGEKGNFSLAFTVFCPLRLASFFRGNVCLAMYVPRCGYLLIKSLHSVAYFFYHLKTRLDSALQSCQISHLPHSDCVQRMGKGCSATQPGSHPCDTIMLDRTLWMHLNVLAPRPLSKPPKAKSNDGGCPGHSDVIENDRSQRRRSTLRA